jgi:tellurite resistance protein TerC
MCLGYMVVATAFGSWIFLSHGEQAGYEFFAGYIIEQSLSVDNMFVFLLIFSHFKIEQQHQHRVLFYGVLGALVLRGLFIYTGVTLVYMSQWVMTLFGVFLVVTSIKMLWSIEQEPDVENNRILLFAKKRLRVAENVRGGQFFIIKRQSLYVTPLFLVLILVETSDILFALDSIPAIFAVTQDPVIIYTSNVFAILGLRALYFALAGAINKFHLLKYGVSLTLLVIGGKMTYGSIMGHEIMTTQQALAVTAFLILGSMLISPFARARKGEPKETAATGWLLGSPAKERKPELTASSAPKSQSNKHRANKPKSGKTYKQRPAVINSAVQTTSEKSADAGAESRNKDVKAAGQRR